MVSRLRQARVEGDTECCWTGGGTCFFSANTSLPVVRDRRLQVEASSVSCVNRNLDGQKSPDRLSRIVEVEDNDLLVVAEGWRTLSSGPWSKSLELSEAVMNVGETWEESSLSKMKDFL